ncbi:MULTISPECIES: hypothetical protein [Chryseobacterium]|uniref:Uncharacterized protein n=1 Tax=Chryseobacterium nepalense TaxID=1854498 RepID=A0ABY4K643_9FLAO|nr:MULTISPECIES: hypothetical protein [Chryseobacterium]MEA1848647.1 hypothetical protein [Chryseobacterium sp. MHB01]MEC5174781.1 hypothetical protein [Chryseobacterium nepalense]UPQ76262.1 hypothetical protein M0D58_01650 [Chryseobacterium nepalense]
MKLISVPELFLQPVFLSIGFLENGSAAFAFTDLLSIQCKDGCLSIQFFISKV